MPRTETAEKKNPKGAAAPPPPAQPDAPAALAYWTDARPAEAQLQGNSEMLVSVAVNGRPLLAIIDSGASVSAYDRRSVSGHVASSSAICDGSLLR